MPASAVLVFSAHAADFVWRAGGAIALYVARGYRVRILCLSFGERGESPGAWKEPGMTIDRVKTIRRAESERAAGILGADVRFFDAGDYPLQASDDLLQALVEEYRSVRPEFVLTPPRPILQSGSPRGAPDLAPGARLRAGRRLSPPGARRRRSHVRAAPARAVRLHA